MGEQWKVVFYQTFERGSPVKEFIDSLEQRTQTKVHNTIYLLKEFGTTTSNPHVKKLTGTELWELRILGQDSIRIFYIAITGKAFLLLHGFKKKKNKTPTKEITVALKRLEEHRANN